MSIGKFDKSQLEKDEMFTTNPKISDIIAAINEKRKISGKAQIGYIKVNPKHRGIIRLGGYFPFSAAGAPISIRNRARLKHLGLASRIEMRILQDLKRKMPECKVVVQQHNMETERKKQLRARDSLQNAPQPVSFDEEILRIARYIGSHAPSVKRRQAARKRRRM